MQFFSAPAVGSGFASGIGTGFSSGAPFGGFASCECLNNKQLHSSSYQISHSIQKNFLLL